MSRSNGRVVEWMLKKLDVVVVFGAMTWAVIWVRTKREEAAAPPRWRSSLRRPPERKGFEAPGTAGWPGAEDPDGGAAWDRARRRRLIDY